MATKSRARSPVSTSGRPRLEKTQRESFQGLEKHRGGFPMLLKTEVGQAFPSSWERRHSCRRRGAVRRGYGILFCGHSMAVPLCGAVRTPPLPASGRGSIHHAHQEPGSRSISTPLAQGLSCAVTTSTSVFRMLGKGQEPYEKIDRQHRLVTENAADLRMLEIVLREANPKLGDQHGRTITELAIVQGHLPALKIILARRPNLRLKSSAGLPLEMSARTPSTPPSPRCSRRS